MTESLSGMILKLFRHLLGRLSRISMEYSLNTLFLSRDRQNTADLLLVEHDNKNLSVTKSKAEHQPSISRVLAKLIEGE